MSKFLRITVLFIFGIMSKCIWAFNYCDTTPYVIFHINGINTTKAEAKRNGDRLEAVLGATFKGQPGAA